MKIDAVKDIVRLRMAEDRRLTWQEVSYRSGISQSTLASLVGSGSGDPKFGTVSNVLDVLGCRIEIVDKVTGLPVRLS